MLSNFRLMLFPIAALFMFATPFSALAHHQDPTTDPHSGGNHGVSTSTGTLFEIGHSDELEVLLAVSWAGIEQETGNHHVYYQYFTVSTQLGLGVGADGLATDLPTSLSIDLVPVTRVQTSHDGWTRSWRFLPTEIRREVDSGMNASVAIQAIGWTIHTSKEIGHDHPEDHDSAILDEHTHHAVSLFASLAVDVLGLRYAQFAEHGEFLGGQLGALQGQAGLAWSPTESVTFQLSVGGRGNMAAGTMSADGGFALIQESDLFARIQALLDQGLVQWNVGLEAGYHQLGLIEPVQSHSADATNHAAHGHAYVMISVGGRF